MTKPYRLIALSLLLPACSASGDNVTDAPADSRSVDGIVYSAETAIAESFPVQLYVTVSATNSTGDAAQLVFPDGCIVMLRAYDDAERSGEPAWDQSRLVGCTAAIEERTIPGGSTIELRGASDARDVLGDSLPDGRYWLSAVLRPNGDVVEVPAGSADLDVPRD